MATNADPLRRSALMPAWTRPRLAMPGIGQTPITTEERRVVNFVSIVAALSVFTMKFTIGFANIESTFAIVMVAMIWLLVTRQAKISLPWLTSYLAISTLMLVWQIINPTPRQSGITGVVYLIALYLPFLMRIDISRAAFELFLKRFQLVCLAIAFMVLLGWAMQAAHMKMLSMEPPLSGALQFRTYVYLQPIIWGSRFTKPNGFFMLETSFTAQLMAMGFLIELCVLRRLVVMAILGGTLISTFGGTGFMMILMAAPVVLFYLTPRQLLLGLLALPLAGLLALQIGVVDNAMKRSGELTGAKKQSSGYGRFMLPYQVAANIAAASTNGAIFGAGAGNLPKTNGHAEYVVNPISKLVAEYGLLLGVAWFIWFHANVLTRRIPFIVSLAPLLQYNFMNGSLLVPINIYYVLLLSGMFYITDAAKRQN